LYVHLAKMRPDRVICLLGTSCGGLCLKWPGGGVGPALPAAARGVAVFNSAAPRSAGSIS
jgi:hypothetical protein